MEDACAIHLLQEALRSYLVLRDDTFCVAAEIQRKERVMIITLMTGGHVATS